MKRCSVEGCERKHRAKGFCNGHYLRDQKGRDMGRPIGYSRAGENNPKWRGGRVIDRGRVLAYCPNHPNPSYCGSHVFRYRLVMEAHLGRHLLPSEIVHHKNGIKDDDRIENLEVMTQSEHAKMHFTKGERWAFSADACKNCGTTDTRHEARGLCFKCYSNKTIRLKFPRSKGPRYAQLHS